MESIFNGESCVLPYIFQRKRPCQTNILRPPIFYYNDNYYTVRCVFSHKHAWNTINSTHTKNKAKIDDADFSNRNQLDIYFTFSCRIATVSDRIQNGWCGFLMHLDYRIIDRSRRAITLERGFYTCLIRRKCPSYVYVRVFTGDKGFLNKG